MRRLLVLLLLVIACGKREVPVPPAPAPTTRDGGALVRRLEGEVATLNYLLQTTEDEAQVLALLYDPLIAVDQNLEPIPATAARWEILDGGKTFVLHLDPRATFADGQPVRASDVVFTLNKIFEAESPQFAPWFESLDREQTKAVDERTVRVVFKEAHAGRVYAFQIGVMPEHVYAKENFAKTTKVVGNGPYVVKSRQRGRGIVLERNAKYWRDKPAIQTVTFRVITDDATGWRALQRGDVDVARVNNATWARVKDDPAVTSAINFHSVYRLAWNAVAWNLDDPLFADARVRRALAMAFDRQAVIDRLYAGQARAVTGPFTPDQPAHSNDVTQIEFNPTAASALLSSAGWHDTDRDGVLDREGKPFAFKLLIAAGSAASRDQMLVLQEALRAIGVKVELRAVDDAAFYGQVFERNFQAAYLSWVNEIDPDPSDLFHSTQLAPGGMNVIGYRNAEADQLMDEARTEMDAGQRRELYHRLHDVLSRDQPYLWTVQVAEKWGVRKRVQNVQVAKGRGLFEWWPDSRAWWLKE
jgi:peptide/nickel transport system substrate-binding protein